MNWNQKNNPKTDLKKINRINEPRTDFKKLKLKKKQISTKWYYQLKNLLLRTKKNQLNK